MLSEEKSLEVILQKLLPALCKCNSLQDATRTIDIDLARFRRECDFLVLQIETYLQLKTNKIDHRRLCGDPYRLYKEVLKFRVRIHFCLTERVVKENYRKLQKKRVAENEYRKMRLWGISEFV